jgi:hypothetical protein
VVVVEELGASEVQIALGAEDEIVDLIIVADVNRAGPVALISLWMVVADVLTADGGSAESAAEICARPVEGCHGRRSGFVDDGVRCHRRAGEKGQAANKQNSLHCRHLSNRFIGILYETVTWGLII